MSSGNVEALKALAVQYLQAKGKGKGADAGAPGVEKFKRLRRMDTEEAHQVHEPGETDNKKVERTPEGVETKPKKPKKVGRESEEVETKPKKPKKVEHESEEVETKPKKSKNVEHRSEEVETKPKKPKKVEHKSEEVETKPKKSKKVELESEQVETKPKKSRKVEQELEEPETETAAPKKKQKQALENTPVKEESSSEGMSPLCKVQLFPEGHPPKKMVASVTTAPTIRLRTKTSLESVEESEERAENSYSDTPSTSSPGSAKCLGRPTCASLFVCSQAPA